MSWALMWAEAWRLVSTISPAGASTVACMSRSLGAQAALISAAQEPAIKKPKKCLRMEGRVLRELIESVSCR